MNKQAKKSPNFLFICDWFGYDELQVFVIYVPHISALTLLVSVIGVQKMLSVNLTPAILLPVGGTQAAADHYSPSSGLFSAAASIFLQLY